jgi:glycosyltransferase involved in cell wall biosynthesis
MKYSIGITTYKYRFEKWFKPLLNQIKKFRPDIEVLVCVNGENTEDQDEEFRKEFFEYISTKRNTFVTMYPTFRGLPKMWNNLLINSSNHHVLLLNDDITITDEEFFRALESVMSERQLFKINGSWSHAFFDRRLVNDIGWFDERYLGIGEEDGDFEWRLGLKTGGKSVISTALPGVVNHVDGEDCLKGMRITNGKYSEFNLDFAFKIKYEESVSGRNYGIMNRYLVCKSPTPPLHTAEAFYWENKHKL